MTRACYAVAISANTFRQANRDLLNFRRHELSLRVHPAKCGEPRALLVGLADDLNERLCKHNAGEVHHTSKFKPWVIKTAIAFRDRERASAFERYLKSGSGRAFARKHL